jgi:hypothetical protein
VNVVLTPQVCGIRVVVPTPRNYKVKTMFQLRALASPIPQLCPFNSAVPRFRLRKTAVRHIWKKTYMKTFRKTHKDNIIVAISGITVTQTEMMLLCVKTVLRGRNRHRLFCDRLQRQQAVNSHAAIVKVSPEWFGLRLISTGNRKPSLLWASSSSRLPMSRLSG